MGLFDNTLILTDLDGTLLDSNAQISKGNIDAIMYYMENGGKFSFATGRNYLGMKYFYDIIPANAPAVTSNGAVIYDMANGCPCEVYPMGEIAEDICRKVLDRFDDIGIEVMLADSIYVLKPNIITDRHIEYTKMTAQDGTFENIPKPWVHLLLTRDPATIAEVYDYVTKEYGDKVFVQYSASYFLEVLVGGANKGSAARRIAEIVGVPQEGIYTVGDGQNDVELLSCTKNSFSPSNSHPDILRITANILPDNDNDPLAALVEHIKHLAEK